MAKSVSDPHREEQVGRALWLDLGAPPAAAVDAAGRRIELTPSASFMEINRRARIIAVSDALAGAVVTLLGQQGVHAEVDHVRVDPNADGDEQVLALRSRIGENEVVVPIRPGALQFNAYTATDEIVLDGEPLLAVAVPDGVRGNDGWVPAGAIVAALREHLDSVPAGAPAP